MEKVLHTFSIMKVLRTFYWPFLYDVTSRLNQCSPMRSEFKRNHEELDFSNAVCDSEAKLRQEVLELRLREGPPRPRWVFGVRVIVYTGGPVCAVIVPLERLF